MSGARVSSAAFVTGSNNADGFFMPEIILKNLLKNGGSYSYL